MSLRRDSWYEATARRDAPLPALEGDIDADVCVVGAGLSGCSTAMHLAHPPGQEGRAARGGAHRLRAWGCPAAVQIIPGWAGGMDKIAAQLGKADAKRIWDFSLEGVEMTRELIEKNRIDCDLAWGHMHVAMKPRQRQELLDMQREQEGDFGYRKLRFMEREETEPGSRASATSPGSTTPVRGTCIRCATRSASARPRSRRVRASSRRAKSRASSTARRSR